MMSCCVMMVLLNTSLAFSTTSTRAFRLNFLRRQAEVARQSFLQGLLPPHRYRLENNRRNRCSTGSVTFHNHFNPSSRSFSSATAALPSSRLSISDSFDSGNIELADQISTFNEADQTTTITVRLRIKSDVYTELERATHLQYFAFKSMLQTDGGPTCLPKVTKATFVIENASKVSYPRAWNGSTVFVGPSLLESSSWRRVLNTSYNPDSGELSWTFDFSSERCGPYYFCYFPPFTYTQHLDLIAQCAPYSEVESLGQTLEGRDIDCISVGSGDAVAWVIHRQHPGEPMASYFAAGLLTRLLGLHMDGEVDGKVRETLQRYRFHIVPLMCPDGVVRGHLRTNGSGANLNREWATVVPDYEAPSLQRSPEVRAVLERMKQTGVDVFVDVHGDEELPFNFLSGSEGSLNWGPRLEALHGAFVASYCRANSDMQSTVGYSPPTPGRRAAPNIATNAIADRFDCLSVTLEMPFKDCASNPDLERGWSPNRARHLGASLIDALCYVHPYLRSKGDFWAQLPKEDAYIKPSRNY